MVDDRDANIHEGEYEEVEEGAHPTSRYSSFSNKKPSRTWGIEETRIFYNVSAPIFVYIAVDNTVHAINRHCDNVALIFPCCSLFSPAEREGSSN